MADVSNEIIYGAFEKFLNSNLQYS